MEKWTLEIVEAQIPCTILLSIPIAVKLSVHQHTPLVPWNTSIHKN